jgi:hypothetical protein
MSVMFADPDGRHILIPARAPPFPLPALLNFLLSQTRWAQGASLLLLVVLSWHHLITGNSFIISVFKQCLIKLVKTKHSIEIHRNTRSGAIAFCYIWLGGVAPAYSHPS